MKIFRQSTKEVALGFELIVELGYQRGTVR